jgi:transcriptional regulator with XRE-family HTH domain
MIPDRAKFCARLKQARRDAKLKQEQVARYLQIPISAVSGMESGSRKVDALELFMLSKLFNKPLSWFFGEEDRPAAPAAVEASPDLGNDVDPIIRECIKLLERAPKDLQRSAAYGVIGFLSDR